MELIPLETTRTLFRGQDGSVHVPCALFATARAFAMTIRG